MKTVQSALLFLLSATLALAQAPRLAVIKAGRVVDPQTAIVAANQKILIENDKIKSIGANFQPPAGAAVIDLSGLTVLPGLMDCHTHLCVAPVRITRGMFDNFPVPVRWDAGGWPGFYLTILLNPTGYRAIHGVAHAREMLESGFTTVRDLGHAGNYADTDLRRAIEEDLIPGPTILNSGKKISPYGGQMTLQPDLREHGNPDYLFADTRDEMRKAIRENVHYGARVIKIVVAGQRYEYSTEDIRFIVEEAARAGLKVSADCATRTASRHAAEAGLASIEHAIDMEEKDFAVAKRNNVALIINIPPELFFRESGLSYNVMKPWTDRLRLAYRSGVRLAFGTDVVFSLPGLTHGQASLAFLQSYIEAGIPAPDILRMMTTNAAELLGVEKERGALQSGLYADLVAVPGNPLEDIQTLKKVSFVMKDGKVIKPPASR
ncbi:MAG: amidohydrolase family protein [Acidobacteria bacterium]|nr:amidohydrolase family protein [Acidobacteriota bacterium]